MTGFFARTWIEFGGRRLVIYSIEDGTRFDRRDRNHANRCRERGAEYDREAQFSQVYRLLNESDRAAGKAYGGVYIDRGRYRI